MSLWYLDECLRFLIPWDLSYDFCVTVELLPLDECVRLEKTESSDGLES